MKLKRYSLTAIIALCGAGCWFDEDDLGTVEISQSLADEFAKAGRGMVASAAEYDEDDDGKQTFDFSSGDYDCGGDVSGESVVEVAGDGDATLDASLEDQSCTLDDAEAVVTDLDASIDGTVSRTQTVLVDRQWTLEFAGSFEISGDDVADAGDCTFTLDYELDEESGDVDRVTGEVCGVDVDMSL